MVMTTETRFGLQPVAGNQIVDWVAIDGNYRLLGNNAAHLSLGNSFSGDQTFSGNVGVSGVGRRLTLPVPAANMSDRLQLMAESVSPQGTYLGIAGPRGAGAGQRHSMLAIYGVEPTGS